MTDTDPAPLPPPLPPPPPPAALTPTRPTRKRRGCLWVSLAGMAALFILALFGIAGYGLSRMDGCTLADNDEHGVDEYPDFEEVWSCGDGDIKAVRIPLYGGIFIGEEDGFLATAAGTAAQALQAIRRATLDPEVRAIILEIDSGGGGITASDVLYEALRQFKGEADDRVVVALFGDVAASGAYYVAMGADYIVAHPTTLTGSIGVIIQSYNLKGLADRVGVHDVTIKSGANKDLFNPFQDMTPEQHGLIQHVVNAMHDRFVGIVAEGRKLPLATIAPLADGRVFVADDAKELGLLDAVGYWDDAVAAAERLCGDQAIKVFRYEQEFSFRAFLQSATRWQSPQALLHDAARPRLLYQWRLP